MQTSLFWDAKKVNGEFDRVYSSEDFAAFFQGFWGDGVIPNRADSLAVKAVENSFSVVVKAGEAFIGGRLYQNTEDFKFTLDISGARDRTDYVVLRMDRGKREVYLKLLKGEEGGVEPSFASLDNVFDLVLAKVRIPANAEYLSDENVTDTRGTALCPWINLHWDITNLQGQFQEWYEGIQAKFDNLAVGDMEKQIEALKSELAAANERASALEAELAKARASIAEVKKQSRNIVSKDGNIYLMPAEYDAELDTELP